MTTTNEREWRDGAACAGCRAWGARAGVSAYLTSRHGGVSVPPFDSLNLGFHTGDDPLAVAKNRARVQEAVGGRRIAWIDQCHGTDVVTAEDAYAALQSTAAPLGAPPGTALRADVLVTDTDDLACAVMVADCLPVLLADARGRAVAAAHAGWRGLQAGVLEAAVMALQKKSRGGKVLAYLGPAIGPLAFEVGGEVRAAFLEAATPSEREATHAQFQPGVGDRFLADLNGLARLRLARMGVAPQDVTTAGVCTYNNAASFYSYRRDGRTGRFAALIWKPGTRDASGKR